MQIPEKAIKALVEHLTQYEEAGALGHVILSVLPDPGSDIRVTVKCMVFGPEENSPDHQVIIELVERVLDSIGHRITFQ